MTSQTNGRAAGKELAHGLSIFEIDQALDLLVQSVTEQAAESGGEIGEELQLALTEYVEAYGEKVDRIASYLKSQEGESELAKKEAARLQARAKAAENRAKNLKGFLCMYMASRSLKQLKGELNTITLANNSVDSLSLAERAQPPERFHSIRAEFRWEEWREVVESLPPGTLKDRLSAGTGVTRELDRVRLAEAIKAGLCLDGARVFRGQHIRLS